nr:GATA transcription factor 26-like [Tanacetum cinerariifolium]
MASITAADNKRLDDSSITLAQATELLASRCSVLAKSAKAVHDLVVSVVQSTITINNPSYLMTHYCSCNRTAEPTTLLLLCFLLSGVGGFDGHITYIDVESNFCSQKDAKCKYDSRGSVIGSTQNFVTPGNSVNAKRSQGPKTIMKSPKRTSMKARFNHKELMNSDYSGFTQRSLFALPPDHSSLIESLRYVDENSKRGLLLDVPSNTSFPRLFLDYAHFGLYRTI